MPLAPSLLVMLKLIIPMASSSCPRRHVYIDMGVNWGNTLRLFEDIEPNATSAFDVYGFEANPLIQPFADSYVQWLNGDRTERAVRAEERLVKAPELVRAVLRLPNGLHLARRLPKLARRRGQDAVLHAFQAGQSHCRVTSRATAEQLGARPEPAGSRAHATRFVLRSAAQSQPLHAHTSSSRRAG